jgi:hypothetical protein
MTLYVRKQTYITIKKETIMNAYLKHIAILTGVVLSFLLSMTCCYNYSSSPELQLAEQLMDSKPDSSLNILNNLPDKQKLSEYNHALYCLLLTQAQDKNFIIHTSDSICKIAVKYFEKHSDIHYTMLAYYCMGRVYSDLQDALQAQEYYLKALEIGKNSKEYKLLIRISSNLGTLYNYQGIYDMALPFYKQALHYTQLELQQDSLNISYILRNIARTYTQTNQSDSAIWYYQKAIDYSTPKNLSSLYVDLGNIHFSNNEYEETKKYLNKALNVLVNKTGIDYINLSKGKLYTALNSLDSAKFYLNLSLQSPYIHTKAGSLQRLANVALKENDFKSFAKYTLQYEELRDSITNRSHFENIRLTQSMFNYQQINKEKIRFEKEATDRLILVYQIVILFVIILAVGIYIYKREQNKKKRLLEQKEQQYKRSQQYLEDNKKQIAQLEKILSTEKAQMTEVQRQLYEARKVMLQMENRTIIEKQGAIEVLEQDFHSASLYLKIHREEEVQLNSTEWFELRQLIDATYSDFTNRLIKLYPKISQEEIRICYLSKMDVPVKKIATIVHITSSGVSQCRRRLYKKFTNEPANAENFTKFIADF